MTSLRIKYLICGLLYLTLNVVSGKHIISRNAVVSNSTITNIDGITCFVCSPAKHLSDCTDVQKCQPGEFCYLEHVYDIIKGTYYYVGGCRISDTCHLQTCLKDHASRRQEHTKLVHCSECCSSSFCNGKLCNLPDYQRLNFTRCYSCEDIIDPKRCHHIVDCSPNEICSVDAELSFAGGAHLNYDLGCKQKTVCEGLPTIQKRQIQLTSKCCNTTLCNDHYKGEDNYHVIVRPAGFTCPPMPTTFSPTKIPPSTTPSSTTTSMPTTTTTTTPTTITTTTITTPTKHTTTTPSTTTLMTTQFAGQCRDRPGTGISCTELMSISGFCSSLIADKYCAESCNHCTNTGHIMTPDPVITSHIMTTEPVIAGNFLTPDPQTIFGKK